MREKIFGWAIMITAVVLLIIANVMVSNNQMRSQAAYDPCPTSNAPIFQTATAIKQHATAFTPTVDTFTPIPVMTPIPSGNYDSYKINVASIYIRTTPSRSGLIVGGVVKDQVVTVTGYTLAGGYWWGQLTSGGYIALREGANNWYALKQ